MNFAKFCALTKLERSFFSLPFLVTAFLMPLAWPQCEFHMTYKCLLALPAFFAARISGMTFNQWLDARFDAKNTRTAKRLIPQGEVSPRKAALISWFSLGIFILSSFLLGVYVAILSLTAAFLIALYSLTKRFTFFCHFVLGMIYFIAILMSWLLVAEFKWPILFLSFASFFLISGSDIFYSLQDYEFDKKEGLYSLPVVLGVQKAKWCAFGCYLFFLLSLILLFLLAPMGKFYLLGLCGALSTIILTIGKKEERIFSLCNMLIPFFVMVGTLLDIVWRA